MHHRVCEWTAVPLKPTHYVNNGSVHGIGNVQTGGLARVCCGNGGPAPSRMPGPGPVTATCKLQRQRLNQWTCAEGAAVPMKNAADSPSCSGTDTR